MSEPPRASLRFRLISAALAFLLWGGWALHVNRSFDATGKPPWAPAMTQGAGSFVITLMMVSSVEWLFHRIAHRTARLILPGLIVVVITGTCLALAHSIVGTPRIVATIAPALSVALAFNIYTAARLQRAEARHLSTAARLSHGSPRHEQG